MIVMKFGGTSVQDPAAIFRLGEIVKARFSQKPVVVVSAVAKVTDTLYAIASAAEKGRGVQEAPDALIAALEERHHAILQGLIQTPAIRQSVEAQLKQQFDEFRLVVQGGALLSELSRRSRARIVSFGELWSSILVSGAIAELGLPSQWVDIRPILRTRGDCLKGQPDQEAIDLGAKQILVPALNEGKVIVTQGFIGSAADATATILGRGGSDYSASLLGLALGVEEIQIWTDVDGLMTADPKRVKSAQLIRTISFEETSELAYFGAKLHPMTIQPAVGKSIPVRMMNAMKPEGPGTMIFADVPDDAEEVKSIACKEKVTLLNIFSTNMLEAHGFLRQIFTVFDDHETSVDVIATSQVNVSLTLDDEEHLSSIVQDLSEFSTVSIDKTKSLVCVVGRNIREKPEMTKRIFEALDGFRISVISMGGSAINISLLVERADLNAVVRALHQEFFH